MDAQYLADALAIQRDGFHRIASARRSLSPRSANRSCSTHPMASPTTCSTGYSTARAGRRRFYVGNGREQIALFRPGARAVTQPHPKAQQPNGSRAARPGFFAQVAVAREHCAPRSDRLDGYPKNRRLDSRSCIGSPPWLPSHGVFAPNSKHRALVTKENPFLNHQEVTGDTRQGSRSAAGSDGAGHRAEIQSMSEPPHQLRLTATGHEISGLVRGGQGSFSGKGGS